MIRVYAVLILVLLAISLWFISLTERDITCPEYGYIPVMREEMVCIPWNEVE